METFRVAAFAVTALGWNILLASTMLPHIIEGVDPPADWKDAFDRGDLMWTSNEALIYGHPEVGNGFVATIAGSDDVFVHGAFHAPEGKGDETHRARLPAPLNLRLEGHSQEATALDIRNGAFVRRYKVSDGTTADVSFFAHRSRKSLLVVEVVVNSNRTDNGSVNLNVAGFGRDPSSDDYDTFSTTRDTLQGQNVVVWQSQVSKAETSWAPKVRVAIVLNDYASTDVSLGNGETATFVAAVRTSTESSDPVEAAKSDWADAMRASDKLYTEHSTAWADIWKSGFEVSGRLDVARVVNTSLYYILSSVREDIHFSLSPGGLAAPSRHTSPLSSSCYFGHSFWDTETWMYPSMVLWHPEIAASLLQYRIDRAGQAEQIARYLHHQGAQFPWESAATGADMQPSWTRGEIHITGDIAFAARQLWYATQNKTWLRLAYPSLVKATADFWASRVSWGRDGRAHIYGVIAPDEYQEHANDEVYTNYLAKLNLLFASEAATALGEPPNGNWDHVAEQLYIQSVDGNGRHPEYSGYKGQQIKQADVVLLGYPLMMDMPTSVREADLEFYADRTDIKGPAMTWAMHAIGYIELASQETDAKRRSALLSKANFNFDRAFLNANQPILPNPFHVWSEGPVAGCDHFITGAGGFLQAALYGLPGARVKADRLDLNPTLLEGMTSVKVRGIHYRDAIFDVTYDATQITLAVSSGAITVADSGGSSAVVNTGVTLTFGIGNVTVTSASLSEILV